MSRPELLDLFCGAGGASAGYDRAGFDVVGVDIDVQPHYPFAFFRDDAMTFPLDGFDAVHASPPCQDHSASRTNVRARAEHGSAWMLAAIRERLIASGLPYVIENVPGAPIRPDYTMCGCMFGLPGLRRLRLFEVSWPVLQLRPPCYHTGQTVTVAGHGVQRREHVLGISITQEQRRQAMGIDWMNRDELAQAIPPAYTELIGRDLLDQLAVVR